MIKTNFWIYKNNIFYFIQSENQTFLIQIRKNIPTVTKNKSNNNNSILISF